jgi:ferredoxin-NADP reductase
MLPESFEVTLREVRPETPDTVTLVLDAPGHTAFRAGQYLSIAPQQFPALQPALQELELKKGRREPQRKYSVASAPHEGEVALTVKREEFIPGVTKYPPLLSGYLVSALEPGARFTVFGYSGPYVLPDPHDGLVVHVVAGCGAVPNFSIVKDALHRALPARHVWLASNKQRSDVLYGPQLEALARTGKLRVLDTLTRERAPGFRFGRIDRALLDEAIPESERASCLVYVCGPGVQPWDRRHALETLSEVTPRFMETVMGHLHAMGIANKRIKREVYG